MAPALSTPRRFRRLILICLIAIPFLLWAAFGSNTARERYLGTTPWMELFSFGLKRMPTVRLAEPLDQRISCYGPRGRLLSDSPDDQLQYGEPSKAYPEPFFGSHKELALNETWMTADGRYGPYGYGEDEPTYGRSKVDWDELDWGELQDDCNLKNAHRFPKSAPSTRIGHDVRFSLRNQTTRNPAPKWDRFKDTRRTALVLRTYQGFQYTAEMMWHIRSLITEAALATGGEYAVFLLVDVHDEDLNLFESSSNYGKAFRQMGIPPEFRSISVLWNERLLESWYDAIEDHGTFFHVFQPLQLFALHYPEFDHYWQLEMDQRFIGDAGKYLDAIAEFARKEPRKQAFERATYPYSDRHWASYETLLREVDEANAGRSRAWGPAPIPDIQPIGPVPPTARSEDDDFSWGVGEDADLIVSSFCADVLTSRWSMGGWMRGDFRLGLDTPRWFCPPAVMRGSRSLLLETHASQHKKGLAVPGEAMLPSWTLWHGLKLSYPPQPVYWRSLEGHRGLDGKIKGGDSIGGNGDGAEELFTGVSPKSSSDGLSRADPQNNGDDGLTWWWGSSWPRRIMDLWLAGNATEDLPSILAAQDGKVYAPNFAIHPIKG